MLLSLRPSRRFLHIVACVALLCAVACKKKAPKDTTSPDQPHPPDAVPGATPIATLERTGCYGECPVYRLTVNSDGSVVYVGTRYVKVSGRQVYKLTEAQQLELEAAFTRANFAQLKDYDRVENTDDDWTLISFRRGAGLKRVRHYHGDNSAPAALTALEDEFDRIVDSGRLVGVANAGGNLPEAPGGATAPTPSAAIGMPSPVPSAGVPAKPARPADRDSVGGPDEAPADPDNHP